MNRNKCKWFVFMLALIMMVTLGNVNVKADTNTADPDVVSVKAVQDDGDSKGYDYYEVMSEEFFEENYAYLSSAVIKSTEQDGLYGSQLTDKELEIYNAIESAGVSAAKNAVEYKVTTAYSNYSTVSSEYKAAYAKAMWAYYRDNLDTMFWLGSSGISYKCSGSGTSSAFVITFTFSFSVSDYYTAALQSSIDAQISKVVSACTGTTRYEKLKYYHDWLVNTNKYDTPALSLANTTEEYYYAHSGVGCMVKGTGVCESYAKCFKTFCMKENIPCLFVTSATHAWNYVRMENGKWYMIDCTFDDPNLSDGSSANILSTTYFMVSNEPSVDTDHAVDDTFTYPTTESSAFSLCSSHSWNSGTVTTAATCLENGEKTYTCTVCGDSKTSEITALGHDYQEVAGSAKAATCTEAGKEADQKCSRCGDVITGATIPAIGEHNYDEGTVTTQATCTEAGVKTYTCTVCNATKTEAIAALGHDYQEVAGSAKAATCTEAGKEADQKCSRCGDVITGTTIPTAGAHSYDEGTVTTQATCTEAGVKTYTCTVCHATKTEAIAALGHDYQEVAGSAKAATCTEAGKEADQKCSRCGDTITGATIPTAGAHSYDEGTITTQATCTNAGVKTYTCTVCNATKTEKIAALGHDYQEVAGSAKAATCTEAGKEADRKCSRCGDTITGATIPATGKHSYDEGTVTTKATCTNAGVKTYTCTVCHATKTEAIVALGHDYQEVAGSAKPATCTEAGKEADQKCSRCGDVITGTTIAATGKHSYDEGTVTTKATCTEAGVKTYTCTVCHATKTEVIAALGHDYQEVAGSVKAATCTEAGKAADRKCSRCDAEIAGEAIAALGHNYQEVAGSAKAATCTEAGKTADQKCSRCGDMITGTAIPATGKHSYDSGKVTTVATNTSNGVKTYTCKVCGAKKTASITRISSVTLYKGVNKTYKLTSAQAASWKITSGSKYASLKGKILTVKATGTVKVYDSKSKKTVKIVIKNPTLKVSKTSITIKKGKSYTLTATCDPEATITWSSSKKTIATVNKNGKVTAKQVKGTCYIYVKANGLTKKVKVTVK